MERRSAEQGQSWLKRTKGPLFLLFGLAAGVVLGLLIFYGGPDLSKEARHLPPSVGLVAEDFQLQKLDGTSLRLEDLRGRPVLVNFWATWCQPCREEMPLFEKVAQAFGDRLIIVGVNYAENQRTVADFAQEFGLHFSIVLDADGEVSERYFVRSYPSSFFIDADGVIRALHLGALNEDQLFTYLETIGIKR